MVTLMNKKLIITLKDAKTGVLHGGAGTFRILIDEEVSGAKHFSLLVNTSNAGTKGTEHGHDVEHGWYILSGRGKIYLEGEPHEIAPQTAVFIPANVLHKVDVEPGEDLTYVVVYAPPGPEQQLKERGAHAFEPD